MSAPTVADLLAFEALPDDVQALARRVCCGETDALFDAGTDEGVSIGRREEAELWHGCIREILNVEGDVREALLRLVTRDGRVMERRERAE